MNEQKYALGLDISTKTVGVCLMDLNGKLISLKSFSPKAIDTMMCKAEFLKECLEEYQLYNIVKVYVEEPLFSSNNTFTVITLAKFNGIISYITYKLFNVEPIYNTIHNLRKVFLPELVTPKNTLSFPKGADKKEIVFDKVAWMEPHKIWKINKRSQFSKENYDESDSYVACKSGLILDGYPIEIPKIIERSKYEK